MGEQANELWNDLLRYVRQTEHGRPSESECWEWERARTTAPYPVVWLNGRPAYVHRLAAILMLEMDEGSELHVLHDCDNPPCFNPKHLRTSTHKENMQDALLKGRLGKKLKPDDVIEIKRLLSEGHTQSSLAKQFNVSKTTISQIARGETWSYLPCALDPGVVHEGPEKGDENIALAAG